jgi:cytochrome P450 family 9
MFFFAGFETTSTLLQMTAYELARNPEIQATLHEEIDEVIKNLDGKSLTYDIIGRMKFLDMVVSESLRKWPPGPQANQRSCTKPYTMQTEDGKDVLLEKGALLFLPVVGLHYDEKYWPNSKKFDPYRFSEERRDQIHPGTYLPFGIGPRACKFFLGGK